MAESTFTRGGTGVGLHRFAVFTAAATLGLIVAGGFLGSLAESAMKDLGRRVGFSLDHDFANALNTFVGGLAAIALGLAVSPISR